MRLAEGGLKYKYKRKRVFFSGKKKKKQKKSPSPPPPPPPTFSRALRRAGFVFGCLAVPNGALRGGQWGFVRIGLRRPVGLDAPTRLYRAILCPTQLPNFGVPLGFSPGSS
jgi:hypothetical protein